MGRKKETKTNGNAKVEISTDMDLDKLLAELDMDIQRKTARKAIKAAANIGNKDYKSRVPVKTGALRDSIKTGGKVIVKKLRGFGYQGFVGATYPEGSHAHLIDLGHKVVPRGLKGGPSNRGSNKKPMTGKATVEGKNDLLKTYQSTKIASQNAVIDTIVEAIIKQGG